MPEHDVCARLCVWDRRCCPIAICAGLPAGTEDVTAAADLPWASALGQSAKPQSALRGPRAGRGLGLDRNQARSGSEGTHPYPTVPEPTLLCPTVPESTLPYPTVPEPWPGLEPVNIEGKLKKKKLCYYPFPSQVGVVKKNARSDDRSERTRKWSERGTPRVALPLSEASRASLTKPVEFGS